MIRIGKFAIREDIVPRRSLANTIVGGWTVCLHEDFNQERHGFAPDQRQSG
jgi:hypothetical protein